MFGYVLPRRDKLSETDNARYRAAYCGLCRCLKQRYGFRARFLVNYDMTFLYFLLQKGEAKQPERCHCPARPFCKKDRVLFVIFNAIFALMPSNFSCWL